MTDVPSARRLAQDSGLLLRYGVRAPKLATLGAPFVELDFDEVVAKYVHDTAKSRHGWLKTWLHRRLRWFLSDFDINGLLGTYPMHVLSTAQWTQLLGAGSHGRLLDVGSGRGDVTTELGRLFDEVTATETSKPMVRRLEKLGFRVISGDLATLPHTDKYDVVSLLNVLDRCDRPLSLLGRARELVRSGGRLVIALVLPYRPFVYDSGVPRAPLERLPITYDSFEDAALQLVEQALLPLGFVIESMSRAPYLSGGDAEKPLYELDDLILVCRAVGDVHVL